MKNPEKSTLAMNKKDIKKIYSEFHVPKHIIAHMKVVAKVARTLAEEINKKRTISKRINVKLVETAALIHDSVRCVDFRSIEEKHYKVKPSKSDLDCWKILWKKYHKIGHEKAMSKILKSKKQNELARLIAKHGFFSVWKLKRLDEKILYYADKRVDRDKIVSLEIRFEEGKKRNMSEKDDIKYIEKTENKVYELEQELIKILGKSIDQF